MLEDMMRAGDADEQPAVAFEAALDIAAVGEHCLPRFDLGRIVRAAYQQANQARRDGGPGARIHHTTPHRSRSSAPCRMKAAACWSITALRFFRLASAAISSRSTAAVEPLVPQADRQVGAMREIAGKGAGRLRARALRPIHVERQPKHEARCPALRREGEQARCIGRKRLPRDRLHPGREAPLGIARGDADRLGAEIEPDQRAALRQEQAISASGTIAAGMSPPTMRVSMARAD